MFGVLPLSKKKSALPLSTLGKAVFLFYRLPQLDEKQCSQQLASMRSVSIDYIVVQQAFQSTKALDALTFVLQLKANFTNSAIYQWSYRKIMSLCHCNFAKAKEIVSTAIKLGWVVEKETKEGYKYLVAVKLTHKNQKRFVFHIADSKAGIQIYLSKKRFVSMRGLRGQNEEQKAARLILQSCAACDIKSYDKAQKAKTAQSFKDVRHKILEVFFIDYIQQFQPSLNAYNQRGMETNGDADMEFAESYSKHGVSYKKISEQFGNLHLTPYQIANIVHSLKKQGLLRINKANCPYLTEVPGKNDLSDDFSEFDVWNEDKGVSENEFNRCFLNKYVSCNAGERCYYKRFARVYRSKAVVTKLPNGRKEARI